MPTAAGIFAYGKTWKTMGPFDLGGRLYRVVGVISVLGVAVLIFAGIQPPNDAALPVTAVTVIMLVVAWLTGVRKAFGGVPQLAQVQLDESGEAAAAAS
jgi:uncharacterized membrane protein